MWIMVATNFLELTSELEWHETFFFLVEQDQQHNPMCLVTQQQ